MAISTERDRRNLLGTRGIGSPIGLPREATTAIGGRHHFVMRYYRGEIVATIGPYGQLAIVGFRGRTSIADKIVKIGVVGYRARVAVVPCRRRRTQG